MRALAKKLREIRATKRRRYRMEGGTVWSSSTAYARGGREQGVHLLETCSFYPLLIERSALGSTGVDWTHQQPLSVAPSRRSPPPTRLIYVRMCVCVCVCVCMRAWDERARQPKDAPKCCAQGRMVIPGVARTISTCTSRKAFSRVSILHAGVRPGTYAALLDIGYWAKVIVRKVNGSSGQEYEIFIYDFDR